MAESLPLPHAVRKCVSGSCCRCRTVDEHRRVAESILRRAALRGESTELASAAAEITP